MKRPFQDFSGMPRMKSGTSVLPYKFGRKLTILALAAFFALAACSNPAGGSGNNTTTTTPPTNTVTPPATETPSTSTPSSIIAVSGITGGPYTATINTPLNLTAVVNPTNATNRTIVWTITEKRGNTFAAINTGSPFQLVGHSIPGSTITVKATIANGKAQGTDYTQSFEIAVKGALEYGITVWDGNTPIYNNTDLPFGPITTAQYNTGNRAGKTITIRNIGNNPASIRASISGDFKISRYPSATLPVLGTSTFGVELENEAKLRQNHPNETDFIGTPLSGTLTLYYGPYLYYTYTFTAKMTFAQ